MSKAVAAVERILGRTPDCITPLSGGSICEVYRVEAGNETWCLKIKHDAPDDFFEAEREGLTALASGGHVRVPAVIQSATGWLLLEWLPPAAPTSDTEQLLGRQLALLHAEPRDEFGFDRDNYCGLTPQRNTAMADGHDFFAECRLIELGRRAQREGLLPPEDYRRLDRVAGNLRQWIPVQPPSLIHGDLWRGNIHFSVHGPALIDPACHHGWGEADLAMTQLFGTMVGGFYDAYREVRPLAPGFDERVPLYNLYHLLNHLNLFGTGWLSQVQ